METTRLGKTGVKVSRICLGTMTYGSPNWRDWVLGEEEARPFIKRALEAGINFFELRGCLFRWPKRRDRRQSAQGFRAVTRPRGDCHQSLRRDER